MYIIFVNATALTTGGGLITFKQFLDNVPTDDNYVYYIFCSLEDLESEYPQKNIKFVFPKYRTGFARIYWDMIGLRLWARNNKIRPSLIVSLQNTATILFSKSIPQISYVMQAIPFVNKQWNIFDKSERILWFYKNIYPFFMSMNLSENHFVVTQSKWIKDEFAKKFNFPLNKILPIRPIIKIDESLEKKEFNQNEYNIFCPSSPFVYKNNIEIANALVFLKNIDYDISKFKVYITFKCKDDVALDKKIVANGLEKNFIFIGRVTYDNMLKYYNGCDLVVFPSYLETFGLPLLEAASFGKPILCSNEAYAIEVIKNYKGAKLLNINSPELWGRSLLNAFNTKKSYKKYRANFKDSWNDFFKLIKALIKGEAYVQK